MSARPGGFAVLTYHRVADPALSPLCYPGLFTDPAEFAAQMTFLASRHRPVSLAELLGARRGEHALPLRSVLVTFDDGYRDFADHAWPILRRQGIPAVLFVPTAYPGDPGRVFWWDRLYSAVSRASATGIDTPVGELRLESTSDRVDAYRLLRSTVKSLPHEEGMKLVDEVCETLGAPPARSEVLGWPELRRLESEGVDLAPHSRTHPLLDKVPVETARAEIVGSLEDLEREVGRASRVFAYPAGERAPRSRAFSKRRGSSSRSRRSEGRTTSAPPTGCGFGASTWDEHPPWRSCAPSSCPGGTGPTREGRLTDTKHAWTDTQRFEIDRLRARDRVGRHARPWLQTTQTCGKGE